MKINDINLLQLNSLGLYLTMFMSSFTQAKTFFW